MKTNQDTSLAAVVSGHGAQACETGIRSQFLLQEQMYFLFDPGTTRKFWDGVDGIDYVALRSLLLEHGFYRDNGNHLVRYASGCLVPFHVPRLYYALFRLMMDKGAGLGVYEEFLDGAWIFLEVLASLPCYNHSPRHAKEGGES